MYNWKKKQYDPWEGGSNWIIHFKMEEFYDMWIISQKMLLFWKF